MTTTTIEQYSSRIEQALRKSFNFGQTYWLQADSESIAQQNKSNETREKFNKFVDDIVFTLAPPAIPEQSNPASALEQYKERCLRVADLLRKENRGWNSLSYTQAINDYSTAIAALPLPVMPEHAEPDETQKFIDSLPDGHEDKMYEQIDAWARHSYMRHKYSVRGQVITRADSEDSHIIWATLRWAEENKKPDTALLARIAELEAENQKLKEDNAWIPIEHCDFDVPVLVKVDGVVQNIVVEQALENHWLLCADNELLEDFEPTHFKYLPE